VYTVQDNYLAPVEPTDSMTFSQYGVVDFTAEGWNGIGWVTLGTVTGNTLVKRMVTFAPVTMSSIRVVVTNALASLARITEIEAYQATLSAGCPAPPSDMQLFALTLSGADRVNMPSGRIGSMVLPVMETRGGSGRLILAETTLSPRAGTVEISIGKCPGVIDTTAGACYLSSTNITFMKMDWLEVPIWGANTDTIAAAYGLCKAYASDGAHYVNMRYSYAPADCTYGTCGFVGQWNYGPY
jgi:hypothetical protein